MATLPNQLPSLVRALPPGTLVDTTADGSWHEPLLWYADGAATADTWRQLLPHRMSSGLQPLLIGGGHRDELPEDWELDPDHTTYPGDHDAEEVLAGLWEPDPTEPQLLAPFGAEWPGLAPAPASVPGVDPDERAAETAAQLAGVMSVRAALVPARRSADIPAAIGWSGPVNHEHDVAAISSVLRSWEDRFGIRVVGLTFDELFVSVASPPTTQEEAEAVAAEHFAFCPDNLTQSAHRSIQAYAEKVVLGQPAWSFWWD
ncbi:DUF4253 domain-containing protein [Streptomyces sp. NBC_01387]|uniref:DUF4253 domain-containing protein n=1 Tax=unclassified Streptomyces TaxID=2593676 RepID=UPI002250692D|nr:MULTISPECIES: DUF4253 domain-containing protein [unclassified Streptomyces]MCX4549077.1 DUF4253 domain-containing protein [Streptomyces sp. NBC_01500]